MPEQRSGLVLVLHSGALTGPARTLAPRIHALAAELGPATVVVPEQGDAEKLYDGCEIVVADYRPLTASFGSILRAARETVELTSLFRRLRPRLVVVATTYVPAAVVAARLARAPVLLYAAEVTGGTRRGGAVLAAVEARLASAVVAASDLVASRFPAAKTERIYPGVAPRRRGDPARLRPPGSQLCLAVVGNVSKERGQDVAIRALALVREQEPTASLLVAGDVNNPGVDGPFRRSLDELAAGLGVADAVHFLGIVPEVEDVYAAADVLVAPTRLREGFGRVPQEALLAGTPVVAARSGALAETLEDGRTALLVPPDDPEAVAAAVRRLAGDPELAGAIVDQGRRRVHERFSETDGVQRFSAVAARLSQGREASV